MTHNTKACDHVDRYTMQTDVSFSRWDKKLGSFGFAYKH